MTLQITTYTDDIDAAFGGYAIGPFVKIRPKYVNDIGLHKHEYTHVNQFWLMSIIGIISSYLFLFGTIYFLPSVILSFVLHQFIYSNFRLYRLYAELDAYSTQLKEYGLTTVPNWCLDSLVNKYDLNYSREEIKSKLEAKIK